MARKIGSRYTIDRVLGRGSAGTVWSGTGPDGPVAVKLLREDLSSDPELVGRFVQERAALTSLDHPCIVGVRDLVVDGDDLALVMELVPGRDLRSLLDRSGVLTPEQAAAVAADLAEGLAAAHAAGVVHRDVKPENALLDEGQPPGPGGVPRVKLTDFGIARLVDTPRRTRATRIVGTPDYLAPEIIEGLPPRAAVDVYALATVLYELLCGATPFGGSHPGAVLRRHVTEAVPQLPGLPEGLARVLTACLAKAPASRLTAAELADRLHEQLPDLAGLPALEYRPGADQDEPEDDDEEFEPAEEQPEPAGAVSLVAAAELDEHDTHLRIRRPTPEELAAGAPPDAVRGRRATGSHARLRPPTGHAGRRGVPAAVRRRRRLVVTVAGLLAAAGLGAYGVSQAVGGDDHPGHSVDDEPGTQPGEATPTAPQASKTADSGPGARGIPAPGPLPHWSGWSRLPAAPVPPDGPPVAVHASATSTFVFARDSEHNLWWAVRHGGGTPGRSPGEDGGADFGPWERLTGVRLDGPPAAVATGGGGVRLFGRGTDGLYYERTYTGGRWGMWTQVDGRTRFDSAPAAASPAGNRIDVVGRVGGELVTASLVDGRWSAWQVVPTAGRISGTPALVSRGDGSLDAFAQRAKDGTVLQLHAEHGAWLPARAVTGLGGHDTTGLAAAAPHGALWVMARQQDGSLREAVAGAAGRSWRTGEVAGAAVRGSAASAAAGGDGSRVDLFAWGSDDRLHTASAAAGR